MCAGRGVENSNKTLKLFEFNNVPNGDIILWNVISICFLLSDRNNFSSDFSFYFPPWTIRFKQTHMKSFNSGHPIGNLFVFFFVPYPTCRQNMLFCSIENKKYSFQREKTTMTAILITELLNELKNEKSEIVSLCVDCHLKSHSQHQMVRNWWMKPVRDTESECLCECVSRP